MSDPIVAHGWSVDEGMTEEGAEVVVICLRSERGRIISYIDLDPTSAVEMIMEIQRELFEMNHADQPADARSDKILTEDDCSEIGEKMGSFGLQIIKSILNRNADRS